MPAGTVAPSRHRRILTRGRRRLIRERLLHAVPVLILATFFVFALLHLTPGDPALALAGEAPTPEHVEEIRRFYGLDQPFAIQYGMWLWNVVHGDLGRSLFSGEPVVATLLNDLPNTLVIVGYALILSVLVGIPLGVAVAAREDSAFDVVVTGLSSAGVAVPYFWLAMILVSVFALDLRWFPATGAVPLLRDPWGALYAATLPAVALAAFGVAEIVRQLRAALVEVLASPHIRTARAKGLSSRSILWKHGLRNVGITLLTVIGLLFNRMLGATVVVEAVFAIPGIGSDMAQAAVNKDYPMIQGIVFALALIVIAANLLIDVLYTLLDPRVNR
jgi:peptide/nickel transport system permease protein